LNISILRSQVNLKNGQLRPSKQSYTSTPLINSFISKPNFQNTIIPIRKRDEKFMKMGFWEHRLNNCGFISYSPYLNKGNNQPILEQKRFSSSVGEKVQVIAESVSIFPPIEWASKAVIQFHHLTGWNSVFILLLTALAVRATLHPIQKFILKRNLSNQIAPEFVLLQQMFIKEMDPMKKSKIKNDLIKLMKASGMSAWRSIGSFVVSVVFSLTIALGLRRAVQTEPSVFLDSVTFPFTWLPDLIHPDTTLTLSFLFLCIAFYSRTVFH
jgi:hypothetical protein